MTLVQPLGGVAPWGADGFVPASEVDRLVAELERVALAPFAPVATSGIDGTTYGVERGDPWLSARLAWWERPPSAWERLASWHEHAITVGRVAQKLERSGAFASPSNGSGERGSVLRKAFCFCYTETR